MNDYRIIFTDIDGTLLNSDLRISERTVDSLRQWTASGRELVLTSSRGISGILPIVRRYGLSCSIIALGGALIVNPEGKLLYENGMPAPEAAAVISYAEREALPAAWNLYTANHWVVRSFSDPKIRHEASVVEAEPTEEGSGAIPKEEQVGKVLFICDPGTIDGVEEKMKSAFPSLTVVRSSDILLEINAKTATKADAVLAYCRQKHIDVANCIAFGDNYNDLPMLQTVGRPVLMGNAPEELKAMFPEITLDHDHDGIAETLEKIAE
jgi:Cof subfamily protein (haloacid dehalogenase superfamily)